MEILTDPATDRATYRIVGSTCSAPSCAEVANVIGLAIGLTTRQLRSGTAVNPTAGSDLGSLL